MSTVHGSRGIAGLELGPNPPYRMLKGLGSSNPLRSASQSVHFAYILEKAETPRGMWRSFCPQRIGESRLTPHSPDSASIVSVRRKNGSLQRPNALWAAFAQPSPLQETKSLISIDRV
jgi:hypothetical protein